MNRFFEPMSHDDPSAYLIWRDAEFWRIVARSYTEDELRWLDSLMWVGS